MLLGEGYSDAEPAKEEEVEDEGRGPVGRPGGSTEGLVSSS